MDYANQIANPTVDMPYENNRVDSQTKVGYFGAYNSNTRNIFPFYNWAINNDTTVYISGGSNIKLESTENVIVLNQLNFKEVRFKEMEMDILVCIANSKGSQIPGKIFYNASYQKPIIVVLDGENKQDLERFLISFDRYILCENTVESIESAITKAKEQIETKMNYKLNYKLKNPYFIEKILGIDRN